MICIYKNYITHMHLHTHKTLQSLHTTCMQCTQVTIILYKNYTIVCVCVCVCVCSYKPTNEYIPLYCTEELVRARVWLRWWMAKCVRWYKFCTNVTNYNMKLQWIVLYTCTCRQSSIATYFVRSCWIPCTSFKIKLKLGQHRSRCLQLAA